MKRSAHSALIALLLWLALPGVVRAADCPGDLNGDNTVTIDEIITIINIALTACPETPCPGDLNGDQTVTIDEVITIVNAAVDGCPPEATPTPTATPGPTSCPYTFTDDSQTPGVSCVYEGAFNPDPTCPQTLDALVLGDGTTIGVSFGSDPIIFFIGTVTSSVSADLVEYFIGTDTTPNAIAGVMESQDDGRVLIVDPDSTPPFTIGGMQCTFERYAGTFTQTVGGATASTTSRPVLPSSTILQALRQQLRSARRPLPARRQ